MRVRTIVALSLAFAVLVAACGNDSAASEATASMSSVATAAPASGGLSVGPTSNGLERGESAPAFEAELLSGSELTLDSLRGRPVVLNFWLTTCTPVRTRDASLGRTHAAARR